MTDGCFEQLADGPPRFVPTTALCEEQLIQVLAAVRRDLATVSGLQHRLGLLGYNVGPADGIEGPRTTAALIIFQLDHNLNADGVYGPNSQQTLQQRCRV